MSAQNIDKKLKIGSRPNIEIMGVPSSVSPREPAKVKNQSFDEDGVDDPVNIHDDEEEEEEDNVYYIDHENIMQIQSPMNG